MTSKQIERDFKQWADPEAAIRSAPDRFTIGELGGHGNGGKCYMTQMFEDHALLHTVRDNKGCIYGVQGGKVAFGYVPDRQSGKDFLVQNVADEIEKCLRPFKITICDLPKNISKVAEGAHGFTIVFGVNPKDWSGGQIINNLIESLLVHHQMITPLQMCRVYVIVNGHSFGDGKPLYLPEVEPMPGFEKPREAPIPEKLKDPKSRQVVDTGSRTQFETGILKIYTSEKNMRIGRGGRRQWRHTINFHTRRSGIIGRMSMLELDVDSSYRDYLYCDCTLESLDPYQRNERQKLVESPLTRAVEAWISARVREYCSEFESRERQQIKQQDRDHLSRINEWLDQWKNQFMQEMMAGLVGAGKEVGEPPTHILPSGRPSLIQISISYSRAGVGVYMRPLIKFIDANGRHIRPVPYRWISEDNNVAMVDEDLRLIQTFSPGTTNIWAETLDRRLKSNVVLLEVVRIREIRVTPEEIEVPIGTRRRLEAQCTLSTGQEISGVHLTWLEDNSSVARVSTSGMVYGVNLGDTTVTAVDESCRSDRPAKVKVIQGEGAGKGTRRGRGYPLVLVSEIDNAPGEEQPAVFRNDEPTVMQRPQDVDNNIWWINLASPFARLYFGDPRYGVQSEAWRMYHVERFIDIIVQIALTYGADSEETFGASDWMYRAGEIEAEIRKRAVESLLPFIQDGLMHC